MRPSVFLGLILMLPLAACGDCCSDTWWNPPLTGGYNPHRPVVDSDNMRRVLGLASPTAALQTEPGDVWPGPLPPTPTLTDMQDMNSGAPLPAPFAPRPETPPPPGAALHPRVAPPVAATTNAPVIVPNGNGTSTVIHPDGKIETIPTPK
jgi:hypothetical protein